MNSLYDDFLRSKTQTVAASGFSPPLPINTILFDWQARVVDWALKAGRAALFEDCGLGKTAQQIEWARQVSEFTGRPVLILAPLAVAAQTVREGRKFGVKVKHVRQPEEIEPTGIHITNYERIELFEDVIPALGGVVLDESSILKSFDGKTRRLLTRLFLATPYKLACTATPSPNDFTELGQHAEFLNICTPAQMLATWFINDTFDTGTWRLKKHAENDFWLWVASWAACVAKPSDAGGDDAKFELPPLTVEQVTVDSDSPQPKDGELLWVPCALSATEMRSAKRLSLASRVGKAAEMAASHDGQVIIWCDTNDESVELALAIPDSIEVTGSDRPEHKEAKLNQFSEGAARVLITKPSIAGFGMNWQNCHRVIFVGVTYSFEDFYQAVRRSYRFGQKSPVIVSVISTHADDSVFRVLNRKIHQHATMQAQMRKAKVDFLTTTRTLKMKNTITTESRNNWTIHHGDCVRVAKTMDSDSVGFSVFSPPFADLFTYSDDVQDMGNCTDLDAFMVQFEFLVAELMRVTMPGRECAVHCCDLLSAKWKDGAIELKDFSGVIVKAFRSAGWLFHSRITIWKSPVTEMQRTKAHGLLYKTLCKDSSSSRVGAPDYLLVFKKPGDNPVPISHTKSDLPLDLWQELASPVWMTVDQGNVLNGSGAKEQGDERHICPLQLDVINRALHLWSAPGDLVFSPFTGIGSEGYCAIKQGRRFVGAELKESYFRQAVGNLELAEHEADTLFANNAA
jgi:DNA modification methylase